MNSNCRMLHLDYFVTLRPVNEAVQQSLTNAILAVVNACGALGSVAGRKDEASASPGQPFTSPHFLSLFAVMRVSLAR